MSLVQLQGFSLLRGVVYNSPHREIKQKHRWLCSVYKHKTRVWQSSNYWRLTGTQGYTGKVPTIKQIIWCTFKSGYPQAAVVQAGRILETTSYGLALLSLIFFNLSLPKIVVSFPHFPHPRRVEKQRIKERNSGVTSRDSAQNMFPGKDVLL